MEIKLSRGEFWILGLAVEGGRSLESLAGDEVHIAGLFNKQTHGLDKNQLVETLCEMFEKKWLEICVDDPEASPPNFIPHRDYIHNVFYANAESQCDGNGHYYYLTQEGGRIWESFAAPQWDWRIESRCYFDDTVEITAPTEKLLKEYLSLFPLDDSKIVESSLQFDTVEPWQATYWKQLPIGYRARFQSIRDWDSHKFNWELSYLCNSWVAWK